MGGLEPSAPDYWTVAIRDWPNVIVAESYCLAVTSYWPGSNISMVADYFFAILAWWQHAVLYDKVDDRVEAVLSEHVGKNKWPLTTHFLRVTLHNF